MKRKLSSALVLLFVLSISIYAAPKSVAEEQAKDQYSHSIGIDSVPNARELGGYLTQDGKMIRYGKLLRTGELTDISEEDLKKLSQYYHVVKDIDLRSTRSIITDGPDPEIEGAEYSRYSFSSSKQLIKKTTLDSEELQNYIRTIAALDQGGNLIHDLYYDGYGEVFVTEDGINMIKGCFNDLLDACGGTVLCHCVNGKDRTGNVTLLLLTILGVDRDTIIADYMLTNEYLSERRSEIYDIAYRFTHNEKTAEDISLISGVSRDWIEQSYATIESNYGSVDNFLHEEIGLTDEEYEVLKNAYLTEPTDRSSVEQLPFNDVSPNAWYYKYVWDAYSRGLMAGTSSTMFKPEKNVTRAEFAAVLYNLSGGSQNEQFDCPFVDVPKDSWSFKYIAWAYGNNLAAGTSKTTYSPNASISRQQMALMLYRLSGSPATFTAIKRYSDSKEVGEPYISAVIWATSKGLVAGYDDNTFRPNNPVSRAQLATVATMYDKL